MKHMCQPQRQPKYDTNHWMLRLMGLGHMTFLTIFLRKACDASLMSCRCLWICAQMKLVGTKMRAER